MGRKYDPVDYETWPEEQKAFLGRVWRGLHDGDLQPLADYIRAGHYLDAPVALEIADAIEGADVGFYHIVAKGRFPGQLGLTASSDQHDRKMAVGVFMEKRLRELGRGGYEAALEEAKGKFGISSSATVTKALRYARDHVSATISERGEAAIWDLMFALHLTP